MKKKKAAKKSVKKAKAKKPARKKTKPAAVKKKNSKKVKKIPAKPEAPKIEGQLIGQVTHYFPHVNAIAVKIQRASLQLGDTVRIKGHTSDFKMQIASMQIDHKPVASAKKGDEIGIQSTERAREGDEVYKL